MASMSGVSLGDWKETGRGWARPFGSLARMQYAALVCLRWNILRNEIRSKTGAFEIGARAFASLFYALIGLGLGTAMCIGAFTLVTNDLWPYLPILFWGVFLLWQMSPLMLASLQEQFDLNILLRFPVSFRSFLLLYLIFGMIDVSTITGSLACLGIWVGITAAHPELVVWTTLSVAGFAGFNILLARAIFSWVDRWLAQRRTREILGAFFMIFVLGIQLLNPALHRPTVLEPVELKQKNDSFQRTMVQLKPFLLTAGAVQKWLPPGLAAVSIERNTERHPIAAVEHLGVLGLWVLLAGAVLTKRLRSEYCGENLGQALSRSKTDRRKGEWILDGHGPIAAVMEKEFRTLLRTLPLLYALGAPLVLVMILSSLFFGSSHGVRMPAYALPISLIYVQLGFTQLFYNNLGVEGAGIQVYFLSPTPIRTVIFAKNIFHSLLYGLLLLVSGILATIRLGQPDGLTIAATIAWLLFALPCNLAIGNLFSLLMPYRVNPGRMKGQRGSQVNAMLSLLAQGAVLAVGGIIFGICLLTGNLWITVPIFVALTPIPVYLWVRILRRVDAIANQRRSQLIATLMKTA